MQEMIIADAVIIWHNRAKTTHLGTKKAFATNAKCLICIANFVGGGVNPYPVHVVRGFQHSSCHFAVINLLRKGDN